MMEVVVTTGAVRRQTSPPTNQHNFLQAGCPCCRSTNSVKALKGIMD